MNVTEKQHYEVVNKFDGFELRHYPACQLATVTVESDFAGAGNRGFYPLVSYIGGGNQTQQKIEMTAPVLQESLNPSVHQIRFVMPSKMSASDLPIPADSRVIISTEPEHYSVARIFSGTCTQERFQRQADLLKKAVSQSMASGELSANFLGEVYFARYDPPWMPGFARRNEVLLRVTLGN